MNFLEIGEIDKVAPSLQLQWELKLNSDLSS